MKYTKEDLQKKIDLINQKTNQKYLLVLDYYLGKYCLKALNKNPLNHTHPFITGYIKIRELYYCLDSIYNTLIYLT